MPSTKIVKIDPLKPSPQSMQLVREAADVLRSGGLVIIPTETVYGLTANGMNPKAVERLYEIKQRPREKPFSLLINEKERAEESARNIPVSAYRLMEKFWPGPLTIILRSKNEGTIGIRMPDNEVALRFIEWAQVPVVCPSANLSGNPAAVNFQEAIKDFEGKVDFAIDCGKTRLGIESAVVDTTVSPVKVLREGSLKREAIEEVANKKTVLFICTGNSCRSVMAEALLKKRLKEKNRFDVEVFSAGIIMTGGLGPTEETREVLRQEGIDIASHRSQQVTKAMIKRSDLILVMEKVHEETILRLAPEVKNRVFLLKEFAKIDDKSLGIDDPISRSFEFYQRTMLVIKEAVERVSNLL